MRVCFEVGSLGCALSIDWIRRKVVMNGGVVEERETDEEDKDLRNISAGFRASSILALSVE
jgi:hypothetical protein